MFIRIHEQRKESLAEYSKRKNVTRTVSHNHRPLNCETVPFSVRHKSDMFHILYAAYFTMSLSISCWDSRSCNMRFFKLSYRIKLESLIGISSVPYVIEAAKLCVCNWSKSQWRKPAILPQWDRQLASRLKGEISMGNPHIFPTNLARKISADSISILV